MQSIFKSPYIQSIINNDFLLLGKGPSYALINEIDTSKYALITLNHAIRTTKANFAHLIDFDVFEACQEAIDKNAQYLLIPWIPHRDNRPGTFTLKEYIDNYPILKKLSGENRIFWYNLSTAQYVVNGIQPDNPIIPTGSFSATVIINLLAALQVKNIYTVGIDGGNTYNSTFDDLKGITLLNNGWASYNRQFREINKTISKNNMSYHSLAVESPVKVYVGSAIEQWLAFKVLTYSIQKYASTAVEVKPLYENTISWQMPKDPGNRPRTPFSFQRFLIPELNDFKGKAIYLDSDMLVFTNIVDLWHRSMGEAEIFAAYENSTTSRIPQFSVMLMNCDRFKYSISEVIQLLDEGTLNYQSLMYEMKLAKNLKANIEPEWNSLEYYEKNKTKLLHYTDMNQQPWLSNHNPNAYLWVTMLKEAIIDGFISKNDLNKEILKGNVKPSLKYQVTFSAYNNTKLPLLLKLLDRLYTPPHLRSKKLYLFQFTFNQLSYLGHFIIYAIRLIPFAGLMFLKQLNRKIRDNKSIRAIYYQLISK